MKTILAYLRTNKMLGNPKNVPEGLSPMFYIGLDRDFEIDIRAKINKEIEDIQSLKRQLEDAREALRLVNLENQLLHEEVNRLNENINELKEKGDE